MSSTIVLPCSSIFRISPITFTHLHLAQISVLPFVTKWSQFQAKLFAGKGGNLVEMN